MSECAASLGKSPNTISFITNTDMFRDFHAARLVEWRKMHDLRISGKLMAVAEEGLDITLELMKDKRGKLPPQFLKDVTTMGLEALGYGPKAGPTIVNNVDSRTQSVVVPVDAAALTEAREALRLAEARRGAVTVDAVVEKVDGIAAEGSGTSETAREVGGAAISLDDL
jgi:hypothetical protein